MTRFLAPTPPPSVIPVETLKLNHLSHPSLSQIIIRARQGHLVQEFRTSNAVLTPKLVDEIHSAWKDYIRSEVNKGLAENERIIEGDEEGAWKSLSQRIQDVSWKQECLKRHEKFDMVCSAAVRENFTPRSFTLLAHLTQIPPHSSGKRSQRSMKLAQPSSPGTPRTQTRLIGLSMSRVE